jgi:sugar lactone lactonase YvrE
MKTNTSLIKLLAALLAALIPMGAHANPGDLYATDNSSIRIYAPDGTASVFASELLRPRGLAFDGFGNLFVATLDTATLFDDRGRILKFAPDGTFTVFATGLDSPSGLAFDGAGNLYVTSSRVFPGGGRVTKITPGGVKSLFAILGPDPKPFHQNFGIAIDERNNLFVADNQQDTIYKITPDRQFGTAREISTFVSLPVPIGLALDVAGNLYASDAGPTTDPPGPGGITKIAPDGTKTLVVSGLGDLRGLAFDFAGNLFAAGHGNNVIYKITPDGSVSIFASGLNVPQFLAVEP